LLRDHLIAEMKRLDVDVHLDSPVDAEVAGRVKPHAVIVATGAEPVRATSSANDGMPVVTGRDILERSVEHRGRIVVAGGGCSGAQTAEYLASQGRDVALLEATGDIAIDAPSDERALLLARLQAHGVKLMPNTRLLSLATGKAIVSSPHETLTLPADLVVLCLGSEPVDALADDLQHGDARVFLVGDALGPRKVTEAIAEGALAILDVLGMDLDATEREEILSLRPAASPDASRRHALAGI
jgi:pyruvate/2-oxoglutarate dehydrogenase complex dihydrolipoamide dehydrogenase (E3) component